MKILLSGSQGTGKSTINEALMGLEQFKDYKQLDSVSKMFASSLETFKNPEKLLDFQTSVSFYCFALYINEPNIVSSRSFADTYAYSMDAYERTGIELFKEMANLAVSLAKRYSTKEYRHIYVPIMFEISGKDLRSTNKEFQVKIDNLFKEFYQKTGIDYLEIKTLNVQDRVDEILEYCALGGLSIES